MKVRLGDGVTAGQELLVIESPELGEAQADLLQRRAAVLAAAPAAELAKAAWERAKGLHERSLAGAVTAAPGMPSDNAQLSTLEKVQP